MKMPNRGEAVIAEAKIVDYLLSKTHEDGQHKAVFFRRFGFVPERWEELAAAIRQHTLDYEVARQDDTPFGTWYTVEGEIETPHGIRPTVRTVWIVDSGTKTPRLVTAYPLSRRRR